MRGIDDEILHKLHDGELDEPAAEAAREALAESPDDARRLASLSQMRALIRAEAEAAADAADLVGLWPAVAARVQQERAVAEPAMPAAEHARPAPGLAARLRAWLGSSMGAHPVRWAAAGVCAVAAAVVLGVLISSSVRSHDAVPGQSRARTPVTDHLEIERMEFKGRHPDIFQITDGKRTTTVIWVYPEDEDEDDNGADNGDDPGSADPI